MRFTPEQDELRSAVRAVLARHEGAAAWGPLTEGVGVTGLGIPEEYGGFGGGTVDTYVVMEELGRVLSPVPYLGSAVLAAQALVAAGDAGACAELLPALADGSAVGALAWAEGGSWEPDAIRARVRGGLLTGVKEHVLTGAGRPDTLLVLAHGDDGLGLYQVPCAEVEFTLLSTMDQSRPQARVVLDRAPARLLAADGDRILARVRDLATAALAAEQTGAAAQALADTVQYARDRVQFGRPIGSFQAVKHRVAELHVQVEYARSLALAAAHADAEPSLAAAAGSACSEAYAKVAGEMIQLHGGIGITWEHPAHRHFKRAHAARQWFGTPAAHRRRLADRLGLVPVA
ncbi:acyl-CoA dehydrogenase [Streptomyces antnestii]|uniref:Acyl-CoA dehydrogenase n=1 Tax=Streptomyces antnestii TaxID=2494256 RepID=A0A437P0H8_9ACTN|nr:acyl-CoA dehydrogenase family protein [Streptomyces sp. San01]RVU15747.1 acyl-CoA dehydrogenase [Streptomyces sp. San01]